MNNAADMLRICCGYATVWRIIRSFRVIDLNGPTSDSKAEFLRAEVPPIRTSTAATAYVRSDVSLCCCSVER